jgi:ribonuclease P protein component
MPEFSFPKELRLQKSAEFKKVYENGFRFNGQYMTAFILPGETQIHKLGVTASKKGIGKAFQRNRAKRLLRESFRLSSENLSKLETKYTWVLNARRSLLEVKLEKPLEDFRKIIESVIQFEISRGEENAALETQKKS